MKKILFAFPSLNRGYYWHPLLAELSLQNNITVLTSLWTGFLEGYENKFNVKIIGNLKSVQVKDNYKQNIVKVNIYRYAIELFALQPQMIFCSSFTVWTFIGILHKIFFQSKLYIFYDGSSPTVDSLNLPLKLVWRKIISRFIDGFLTCTKGGEKYLINQLSIEKEKIIRFLYLLPHPHFYQLERKNFGHKINFIYIGRIIKPKGVEVLLKAFDYIAKQNNEWSLTIIGDGNLQELLINDYKHLSNQISWLNNIPYQKIRNYLEITDCLIFPTFEDVLGLVALEGLAAGLPVICSVKSGASEFISNYNNGILFDPLNLDSLIEAVELILNKKLDLNIMSNNAREAMKRYTIENAVRKFKELITLGRVEE